MKTPVTNFKVDDIEVVINQPAIIENFEEDKERLANYFLYLKKLNEDER